MADSLQAALSSALARLLRPLIRLLLSAGMSYKAFAEVAKWVYVDVATREFALEGRKQSKSRVSILTALTRIDVDRLQKQPPPGQSEGAESYNRAARVLTGWTDDPLFKDGRGGPASLPLEDGQGSFANLVRIYSGGVPVRAVLDELNHAGAVSMTQDGRVRLVKRFYVPTEVSVDKLEIYGMSAADLLATMHRNVYETERQPFFQRAVYSRHLPAEALDKVREYIRRESQKLADRTDDYLFKNSVQKNNGKSELKRAGLGLYYFES